MEKNLAPIVLFVYNRPEHTRITLEQLSQCELAEKSVLYIFADGPKANATEGQKEKIAQVRALIGEKKWCGNVVLEMRENNLGLASSVRKGVSQVIEKHGKAIVLEDDLAVEKGFLRYMNAALDFFETENKVWGISGFGHPLASYEEQEETFFLPIPCSWGWATWQRVWQKFIDTDERHLREKMISGAIEKLRYNFGNYYFYEILDAQFAGRIDSWAALFHAVMYLNDGFFLFPKYSLVKNIGFDASATHTHEDNFFSKTPTKTFINPEKKPVVLTKSSLLVEKAFQNHFGKKSFAQRLLRRIKRFFGGN